MIGRAISTKMKNTAVVLVETVAKHPLYKKTFIQSKKYLVDTASTAIKDGDVVEFIKTKPISKNKHWRITKVIGKNLAEIMEEKLKEEAEEIIAEVMPEEKERDRVQGIGAIEEEKAEKKEKIKSKKEKLAPKP